MIRAMELAALQQRLRLGEDSRTEFKGVARRGFRVDPDVIAKAVVALANSGGGEVFLGVEDDGTVSGIGSPSESDQLMRQVSQVCRDQVQPAIFCRLVKVEVEEHMVLVVEVPGHAPERPFAARGKYYVRDANRSREATRAELIRLLESESFHFDEQPVAGASLDDLDLDDAQRLLTRAFEGVGEDRVLSYLRALSCVDGEVPTLTGVLFFGRDPQRFLLDAMISAARVPDTVPRLDLADRQEIRGAFEAQLEGARAFLARHLAQASRIRGWRREDRTLLPDEVLREALVNALVHRDYRSASQVRLFVYDDRVEVINPGDLLNRLTVEKIRLGGLSQKRNPVIASLSARLERRENLGFGVPEMFRRMVEHGCPEPEIDAGGGHFRLVLRFPEGEQ
jgi:ATP-dependent DNA helicase RecG